MLTFSVFEILTVKTSDESLPRTKQLKESVDITGKMIVASFRVEYVGFPWPASCGFCRNLI